MHIKFKTPSINPSTFQRYADKMQFDRAGVVAAFRTFVTAWVAFALASLLHVENAYWAGMAAWIVMQPTRGILLERGINRVIGTLIGAVAGFAMIRWIHAPYLAVGILAIWVGICALLTHVFRKAHSYGAMLAGITAIVVVLPSLHAHEQTFALAQARVICTLMGVVVATASGLLFVPRAPREVFISRLAMLTADVVAFAERLLATRDAESAGPQAQTLLDEMVALEQALSIHSAGSRGSQHLIHHFSALVASALEVMAAAQAIVDGGEASWSPEAAAVLQALETRLRFQPGDITAIDLNTISGLDERLATSLQDLVASVQDVTGLPGFQRQHRHSPVAPEKDFGLAIATAAAAGAAVGIAGTAALMSSWHFAPLAALGVGNFAILLSSMDRPHIMAPKIFLGVSVKDTAPQA